MDEILDIAVLSGGGAKGYWQWNALMQLHNAGHRPVMLCGTSTGVLTGFLYAKGLYQQAQELYHRAYHNDADNVFKPGLAKVKKGKLKIDAFKAVLNLPRLGKVKSLMTNGPLYDTLLDLQKKHPEWRCDLSFNVVDFQSGLLVNFKASEFKDDESLVAAMVASTSIPVITSLQKIDGYPFIGDGGVREGAPLKQLFYSMDATKNYRIWVLACNSLKPKPVEAEDLSSLTGIAGRMVDIMLNENLDGDLARTIDRNEIAKDAWLLVNELEKRGIQDLADSVRGLFLYRFVPIHVIEYSGPSGVFSFTPEAYQEQSATAVKDVSDYLTLIK